MTDRGSVYQSDPGEEGWGWFPEKLSFRDDSGSKKLNNNSLKERVCREVQEWKGTSSWWRQMDVML